MAEAGYVENIGNGQAEIKLREEVYERLWTISPNWDGAWETWDQTAASTFEFETGRSSEVKTKWLLSIYLCNVDVFLAYWKLIEVGKKFPDGKVQTSMTCALLKGDSTAEEWTDTQTGSIIVGRALPLSRFLDINMCRLNGVITANGELTFKLKLVIMEPEQDPTSADLKVQRFQKACSAQVLSNFKSVLDDEATADVKIITREGKELLAHKVILKAQCPVFESMFRSDLSENRTGVVNVEDISFKTMGILLHLFYSGELLPSWKDLDTVIEFTYAAGKYQLTTVLKLLDEVLGSRDEEDATQVDMQLLDLVQKLNLKTAEKELVERAKRTMSKVNSGAEMFALCGIGGSE